MCIRQSFLQVPIIPTCLYMVLVPDLCSPRRKSLISLCCSHGLTPFTSLPQGFSESGGVGKDNKAQTSFIVLCKVHTR